jgi:lipoprotein NlpD
MFFISFAKKTFIFAVPMMIMLLLSACGAHVYHRVERGETLYSIGWVYGYDYRQIASWNNIPEPYILSPGQRLRVAPPSGQRALPLEEYRESLRENNTDSGAVAGKTPAPVVSATQETARVIDKSHSVREENKAAPDHDAQSVITAAKTAVKKLFNRSGVSIKESANFSGRWQWPTKNRRVLRTFSANNPSRQGLDLAGEKGSAVMAAAPGRVVYAGSGLVRYGRLIIIKHSEKFLSAYAHNQKLRVKEGDAVVAGQRIADMGRSGNVGEKISNSQRAKLHFEIRRNGKPVDPKRYLPR